MGGWVGRNMSILENFHTKLKKNLDHCQGFTQDFELGEGGGENFHVLAKGGGRGGGGGDTLRLI